jgi:hypothetical protein
MSINSIPPDLMKHPVLWLVAAGIVVLGGAASFAQFLVRRAEKMAKEMLEAQRRLKVLETVKSKATADQIDACVRLEEVWSTTGAKARRRFSWRRRKDDRNAGKAA